MKNFKQLRDLPWCLAGTIWVYANEKQHVSINAIFLPTKYLENYPEWFETFEEGKEFHNTHSGLCKSNGEDMGCPCNDLICELLGKCDDPDCEIEHKPILEKGEEWLKPKEIESFSVPNSVHRLDVVEKIDALIDAVNYLLNKI